MLQQKYNTYLGRGLGDINWIDGQSVNTSTGDIVVNANMAIGYLSTWTKGRPIMSCITPASASYRFDYCFYTENNTYLGYERPTKPDRIVAPPEQTDHIIVSIYKNAAEYEALVEGKYVGFYELRECSPICSNLSIKYERDSDEQYFRYKLASDVAFMGDDFTFITSKGLSTKFAFFIYKPVLGIGSLYFKGFFYKADCEIDFARGKITPDIQPLDNYESILANLDNKYNLIELAPAIKQVNLKLRPVMQVYLRGSDVITSFFAGTWQDTEVLENVNDAGALINTYHFNNTDNLNEVTITGTNIGDAAGVYVGGGSSSTWANESGYTLRAVKNSSGAGSDTGYLSLRSPSGAELYRSVNVFWSSFYKEATSGGGYENWEAGYWMEAGFTLTFNASSGTGSNVRLGSVIEYHVYQRVLTNQETIDGQATFLLGASDMALNNVNYKRCVGATGTQIFITTKTVEEPTIFGINDGGQYFTNRFLSATQGQWRPLPVNRQSWGNASIWFAFNVNAWPLFESKASWDFKCKDAYGIEDVISVLLKKVAPEVTFAGTSAYSQFLFGSTMPVSGIARFYTIIAPKSNILKGNYDQAAQKAEITLKQVFDMLAQCFRCYWFIDDNKRLRIEHISYFYNGGSYGIAKSVTLDLTDKLDQFNGQNVTYFQQEVSYDKDMMTRGYNMSWAEEASELFGNINLDVQAPYAKDASNDDVTIADFSADVDLMLANPDNFSMDGFALLLCTKSSGQYSLPIVSFNSFYGEDGMLINTQVQNGYASLMYLYQFYLYGLCGPYVIVDRFNNAQRANSLPMRAMSHEVTVPVESDIDVNGLVSTVLGQGSIEEMTSNLDTGQVDFTLKYPIDYQ